MPTYLTYFSYSNAAWNEMVLRPEDREAATRRVIESNGGRLLSFYWMFGDHDGLAIYEAVDNVVAGSVLAAIKATGRIDSLKTRVLLTGDDAQRVLDMAKFASTGYRPPGGSTAWFTDFETDE